MRPRHVPSLAIAAIAMMIATTACQQHDAPTALEVATDYLDAIADGDASAANALSTIVVLSLPADDSLDGADAISEPEIGAETSNGDTTTFPVSYLLHGEPVEAELVLHEAEGHWRVEEGLASTIGVNWSSVSSLVEGSASIGSTSVEPGADASVRLYPGGYDESADAGPFVEVLTTSVDVTDAPITLQVAASDVLLTEATQQLEAELDACIRDSNAVSLACDGFVGVHVDTYQEAEVAWTTDGELSLVANDLQIEGHAVLIASWSIEQESGEALVPIDVEVSAESADDGVTVDGTWSLGG